MRSTITLWNVSTHPRYRSLEANLDVDVAIVGAGITGLTAAVTLAEVGSKVAVLEARTLGAGVTGATTAHLTQAVDARYHDIESKFGSEGSKLVAQSMGAAIERASLLVVRYGIDCGFERLPGWLYSEDEKGLVMLERELAAAARAGLSVHHDERVPLPFPVRGAVRFDHQAQLDAGRYIDGLANAATEHGARIFERTRVIAVDDGDPCVLHLENGVEVRAGAVFFCTHAAVHRFFLQTKVHAYRSYVAAYPGRRQLAPGLFWDTEDPYHYTRHAVVNGKELIIVGGEDHRTGTETETEVHFDKLDEYVRARFPVDGPAVLRWSAQVEEPVDGLPFIGKRPSGANVYFATGYSGDGTTFGTLAAMILTDAVRGHDNPWAELYAASRIKPIASASTFVRENLDFPVHFVSDWIRRPEARSLDAVAPGEGKIVSIKGQRLAVFRDPEGVVHAVSPVCTHLGCQVNWNGAERSWDCPCHGSRFDVDGKVLHGPASRGLAPRELDETGTPRPVRVEEEGAPARSPKLAT